ncbi:DeoR/GlpR family DNA-binding transcription regulator [Streptomyces sp. NPDC047082]|uniref:DeoR/GlpR family DNA-binding transcription regulator n=1 Tax=Streptomyces sp. NPDC047082 TaxID=3155259 RepID=UPI00292F4F88|nr:DeoR/GlpR family DNA-binding transcription regulator [Streptomyces sp. NEAU-HV9]
MKAEERQHRILALARRSGRVEVSALAADFRVAPETIRRDLNELARGGLVRRSHGGAYPVESAGFETSLAQRETHHVEDKRRIAAAAVHLFGEAETVFIDEGYTHRLIADLLPSDRNLTVVTASLPTAAAVAEASRATVLLLGGKVRGRTLATVGSWTNQMLSSFVIDLAILGANGISRDAGLTTPDPVVADVKAQAIRSSHRRILLGIHTKFGAQSFCRFAKIGDFETIITDTGLPVAEAHRYSLHGPNVIRV